MANLLRLTLFLLTITASITIIATQIQPPFPRPRTGPVPGQFIGPRPPRFNPAPNNRRPPHNFPVDPFGRPNSARQTNNDHQQNRGPNQPNIQLNQQNFPNLPNIQLNQQNRAPNQLNFQQDRQINFQNLQNRPNVIPDQFSSQSSSINHVSNLFNGQLKSAVWESQNDITSGGRLEPETSGGFTGSRQIPSLNGLEEFSAILTSLPPQQSGVEQNVRKKATLKDVIAEDCEDAELLGYCASPPRYPTNQVQLIVQKCADLIGLLYVPVPRDQEPDTLQPVTTRPANNTTRSIERANRQIWSWARYALEDGDRPTVCASTRHYVEPSYVKDASTGRWFVVVQSAQRITQHVTVDKCRHAGEPCNQLECSASNTHCAQRFSYRHLITWDPDLPDTCPKIKVFRFPTACVCQLV